MAKIKRFKVQVFWNRKGWEDFTEWMSFLEACEQAGSIMLSLAEEDIRIIDDEGNSY